MGLHQSICFTVQKVLMLLYLDVWTAQFLLIVDSAGDRLPFVVLQVVKLDLPNIGTCDISIATSILGKLLLKHLCVVSPMVLLACICDQILDLQHL